VGEFLILVGAFQISRPLAVIATSGIIFAAVYMLWMYQRVIFGEVTREENRPADRSLDPGMDDSRARARLHLLDRHLPSLVTGKTEASVRALITQVQTKGGRHRRPRREMR